MNLNCKICNHQISEVLDVKEQMYGTGDIFHYGLCKFCGCLQLLDCHQNLDQYYPENYYSLSGTKQSALSIKEKRRSLKRYLILWHPKCFEPLFKFWLGNYKIWWIYRLAKIKSRARVLDVGAGNGAHVRELRLVGFPQAMGVDPHIKENIFLNDTLLVLRGQLGDVFGEWDLITFHHSLEHIADQKQMLSKAVALLAPGGLILIRIPTVTSLAFEKYKEHWFGLDAPRHLYLHSHESIRMLVKFCGLEVIRLWCDSDENSFIYSEQYAKGISLFSQTSYRENPQNSIFKKNAINEFKKLANKLNNELLGDSICVVCRKF